jgi:hypothetical protein
LVSVVITSSPVSPSGSGCSVLGFDHLEQEVILPSVQAVLRDVAFAGDARTENLGQAVDVDRAQAEAILQILAHRVAPRLGAEQADAQRRSAQVDAHAGRHLGDVDRVGGRRAQDVGAEVLEQRDLPFGRAARHRHHGAPEPLGAVVRAKPSREQAVTVDIVHDVAGRPAQAIERAIRSLQASRSPLL